MTETQKLVTRINKNTLTVENVDFRDYPDFCDAFIAHAEIDGRECSQEEIDLLNEDGRLVNELAHEQFWDRDRRPF